MEIRNSDFRRVAEQAGEILRHHRSYDAAKLQKASLRKKSDGSWVSPADLEINVFLRTELLKLMPCGWLSEEDQDDPNLRLDCEYVWIVDPLDGTRNFLEGSDEVAISVALVHKGQAIMGFVSNPLRHQVGVVGSGGPEFWNLSPPPSSTDPTAWESLSVVVSSSEYRRGLLKDFLHKVPSAKPVGSVAYKLLLVASGTADVYFSQQPKSEWDIAGGVCLIEKSGGVFQLWSGEPLSFNQRNTRILGGALAGSSRYRRWAKKSDPNVKLWE